MIPKEQNMPAYTSRRYSWPGKKVHRDLVDREKSGGEPAGADAGYESRVSYRAPEGRTTGNGCDLVNAAESRNKRDNCDNCSV